MRGNGCKFICFVLAASGDIVGIGCSHLGMVFAPLPSLRKHSVYEGKECLDGKFRYAESGVWQSFIAEEVPLLSLIWQGLSVFLAGWSGDAEHIL